MQLLWMHFQLEFLPGLDVFQQYEPEAFYAASKSDIAEFKNIISDIESSSPVVFIEQRALLLRLLKDFMPDDWKTIQPAPENAERLKPALELLNKKYNQPFDLRATAKTVNMNPAYMSDMFRRTFGAPPSRYLMNLRIRHAQNLLLTTDRRISDIAAECGFENPLYFSRIFTKRCRFSPRHFRQNRGI
jgi:AraC-like DNA-binding protein